MKSARFVIGPDGGKETNKDFSRIFHGVVLFLACVRSDDHPWRTRCRWRTWKRNHFSRLRKILTRFCEIRLGPTRFVPRRSVREECRGTQFSPAKFHSESESLLCFRQNGSNRHSCVCASPALLSANRASQHSTRTLSIQSIVATSLFSKHGTDARGQGMRAQNCWPCTRGTT